MKKKTQAFTLAEALILLLIAALLAAALLPVITRKHKDVGEHGEWICTVNNDGKHVVKTTYRGKVSEFEVAHNGGEYCVFSPPAAAKNFTIKAVGGGGGGAGGQKGATKSIYDSRTATDGVFTSTVEADGNYNVIMAGAGGGGGGMACGEAKYQVTAEAGNLNLEQDSVFEQQSKKHHGMYGQGNDWSWNESTQKHDKNSPVSWCPKTSAIGYDVDCRSSENSKSEDPNHPKYYQYGYVDHMLPGFKYNLLFQNDQKYTDNPEYGYGKNNPNTRYTNERGEWAGNISVYDFKYKYLSYDDIGLQEKELKDRVMCFAEKNWPLSKEVNGDKGLYLSDRTSSRPSIKCWNLPGKGGEAGQPATSLSNAKLRAGESIYVTIGREGSGSQAQGPDNKTVGAFLLDSSGSFVYQEKQGAFGDVGTDGGNTILQLGGGAPHTALGGKGGASRFLKEIPAYKDIPVYECEVYPIESGGFLDEPTAAAGKDGAITTSPSFCTNTPHSTCSASPTCVNWVSKTCKHPDTTDEDGNTIPGSSYDCSYCADTQQYYECSCSKHTGISSYGLRNCVQRVRPKYFDATHKKLGINVCIYSSSVLTESGIPDMPDNNPSPRFGMQSIADIDFPYLNPEIREYDPSEGDTSGENELDYYTIVAAGRIKYTGEPGSGGYGAGELIKNYVKVNPDGTQSYADFKGSEGLPGYVLIVKSDAYGGTGGQAGQYVSTMVKKLDKLKITVGKPGGPSVGEGYQGGETIIKEYNSGENMYVMQGGIGGQALKLTEMGTSTAVKGGDGTASPVENESNRAKIIPLGGYSTSSEGITNSSIDGQTAATSNKIWGKANGMKKAAFNGFSGLGTITGTLNLVGGEPLDMTYGAGGGGGGGSDSTSGIGGAGSPGAVIIKW